MRRIRRRPVAVTSLLLIFLIALTTLSAMGCTAVVTPERPATTAAVIANVEPAQLQVVVKPAGATVLVDDQPLGLTPLTLSLAPGQYDVRVEKDGFQPLEETLTLPSEGQTTLEGSLVDIMPPTLTIQMLPKEPHIGQHLAIYLIALDNVAVARLELWIDDQRVLEEIGATAIYHWNLSSDQVGQHVITGQAYDVTGNMATANQNLAIVAPLATATAFPTPQPTDTPSPTLPSMATTTPTALPTPLPENTPTTQPTPPRTTPSNATNVYYETTLSIATYPYVDYLQQEIDSRYNMPYWWLDRTAYKAAQPTPTPQSYRALIVENEYLQLTFLPELGGRLYRCIHKPTGLNLFYQNSVIKPSRWGAIIPAEHNWWLAVGGMEWALPVHEHGYEFGNAWEYSVEATAQGTTVILWDSQDQNRLRFEVRVTLPSRKAAFVVRPRLLNTMASDVSVQFWINAMLTLGSHTVSPETEFVLPAGPVVVHSTGDSLLAAEGETMPWPVYNGRDLSRYANWRQWLGAFVQQTEQNFAGAYNHATGLGAAKIFPPHAAPGLKLFAFGPEFGDRAHYTDDDSQYFELWGGQNRTFWPADDIVLTAGGEITWEETWLPFADIGGLTFANEAAALYLERQESQLALGLSVSVPTQGWGRLLAGETENVQVIWEQAITLAPDNPLRQQIALPESLPTDAHLRVQLVDQEGKVILDYSTGS